MKTILKFSIGAVTLQAQNSQHLTRRAARFFFLLALVMASGVLRLHSQMNCGLSIDQTLTDDFTTNYGSNYFDNKVLEIEGFLQLMILPHSQTAYFT